MTPLLLAGALVPDSNLTLALAILLVAAQAIKNHYDKRGAMVARANQTAILQGATDEQTVLIIGTLNGLRGDVNQVRLAQEEMARAREIERQDHTLRMAEYKKRLDGHEVLHHGHAKDIGELRERVSTIEKGGKP